MEIWKRNLYVCWFGVFVMSLGTSQLVPILPLYIEELGVHDINQVEVWSGIAFGVTFVTLAIFSPLWGRMSDKYGRKPMLLRASLGMTVVITCIGLVHNVFELVFLRMLQGTISGFYSASITLVAIQTPRRYSGWALGVLFTGAVGGMLLGPLLGGYLEGIIGIRHQFFVMGGFLVISFVTSLFFVKEDFTPRTEHTHVRLKSIWQSVTAPEVLKAMFVTTFISQMALTSIQPIITVYIADIAGRLPNLALISGIVFSATGVANIISAPFLGKLADRIGPYRVILGSLVLAGLVFIPQAFVRTPWELMGLRFLLGFATAGLMPSINTLIKRITPDEVAGQIFGYTQSAQFLGSFFGAVMGGLVSAWFGLRSVFFITGGLLMLNAIWVFRDIHLSKRVRVH
ncbi:multidrug efflux MFS transporter [Thermodesulfovibrio thiophilus]|uniref:multidrug efflux MFS transporter n=1 Tax=Thermodesulfovibrio thiophilus TaxID=340095 RepID=UPI0004162A3C|nr:multidrug efflux MFS transporter [Thermodesulfovibrio thiophilus]